MERLLTTAICGLLAAVTFGALGALFGGGVRVLAKLRDRIPDASIGEAFRNGARGGAVFLAVLGGLFGVLVAIVEPSAQHSVEALRASIGTLALLMLVIGLGIAVPTTIIVWLAIRFRSTRSPSAESGGTSEEEGREPGR